MTRLGVPVRLMKIASKVGLHLKPLNESPWKWKVKAVKAVKAFILSFAFKKAVAIESQCRTCIISSTHHAYNKLHQRRKTSARYYCHYYRSLLS